MKKVLLSLLVMSSLLVITSCNKQNKVENNDDINIEVIEQDKIEESDNMASINVIINNNIYTLNLEDNETTREFIKLLPREFTMNELNGNEKYVYLDTSLPTNSSNPNQINKGDVMLFGDNCLVVFYKTFNTSYSYTKIGYIDNLPDLGQDNIKIMFEQ